ncbi:hypothetical protein [Methanobacterium sp.]|uniref:hypothetical protein n=1 Tax=Methanobacterium sp. TaxID=2164 RepID=UPI0031580D0D
MEVEEKCCQIGDLTQQTRRVCMPCIFLNHKKCKGFFGGSQNPNDFGTPKFSILEVEENLRFSEPQLWK